MAKTIDYRFNKNAKEDFLEIPREDLQRLINLSNSFEAKNRFFALEEMFYIAYGLGRKRESEEWKKKEIL